MIIEKNLLNLYFLKKLFTNSIKYDIIKAYRKVIENECGSVLECDSFVKITSKMTKFKPRGSKNDEKSAVLQPPSTVRCLKRNSDPGMSGTLCPFYSPPPP